MAGNCAHEVVDRPGAVESEDGAGRGTAHLHVQCRGGPPDAGSQRSGWLYSCGFGRHVAKGTGLTSVHGVPQAAPYWEPPPSAAGRGRLPLPCWPSGVGVGSPAEAAVPVQRRHVLPSGHPPRM